MSPPEPSRIRRGAGGARGRVGSGGPITGVIVLLGLWLFASNVVLLAGYTATLQLEEEGTA